MDPNGAANVYGKGAHSFVCTHRDRRRGLSAAMGLSHEYSNPR